MKGRENMNKEFLVPTGDIIKEYLEESNISQKQLAERTNISEKHISNVLRGKSRLTEDFALKLEKVLVGVPASYWLNYEMKYREYLAREEELARINSWDLNAISKRFRFKEVFQDLNLSLVEQAIEMLKLLKISDFTSFESAYGSLQVEFMEDGGEIEAIAIWLNLCEEEVEIQNDKIDDLEFCENELQRNIKNFKVISNNLSTELSLRSCRKLCNRLGIYLVICESISNSKVRGALTTYKGKPAIYLSGRFKSHSHIWFAFMHEIGHLILHYNKKDTLISFEENNKVENVKEDEANNFARDVFIDPIDYKDFINEKVYNTETIRKFAKKEDTIPEIVVARLQHDKEIGYDKFVHLK